MKKKKQTRKIKQWLAAALGLTLLGTGLWAGMNGEKLQAKPKKVSTRALFDWETPPEKDRFFYGEGPLGEGGPNSIWQNVLGKETYDMIPKEYSFTLLPSDKTEYFVPDESKHLVMGETGDRVLFTPPVGEWASVIFTNMGSFQGESISLKVSFQVEKDLPSGQEPNVNGNNFAITTNKEDKNTFLMVSSGSLSGSGKVKYEFLKSDNQTPIKILSYFTSKAIVNTTEYVIPEGLIKKLYTTKRDSDYPIDIKYSLGSEYFWFTGTDAWNTTEPAIRRTATFTFEDKEIDLSYGASPLLVLGESTTFAMRYTGETYAKIEFPDPQGIGQSFETIDEATEKELNYQFVQQVPYEGKFDEFGINNQDQTLKWTITSPIANQTVKADDWEVVDETGANRTGWFTFTDVDENTAEVIPNATAVGNNASNGVAPSLDEFYNHYYTFKRKLTIDYTKPIDEKLLKDRDGGKYLDKTGTVTLAVNGVAREEQEFKTSINFASTVNYAYLLQGTSTAVPGFTPTTAQKTGDGIITHEAALTPPSPIGTANKYQYASVEPANKIIKYSTQDMKFYYVEDAEPWLPYYKPGLGIGGGGWLDSMESYIPRSNANTLKYLPGKTKVVAHSTGVHPDTLGFNITSETNPTIGREVQDTIAFDTDQPQWIQIDNVGFADGKFFGLEIELKAKKPSGRDELHASYIYLEQENFLQVNTDGGCEGMTVTYKLIELTDVEDTSTGKYISQPIEAGSYSSFVLNNNLGKYEVFSQNNIKNIYSLSRPETTLQYEVDNASKELQVRTLTAAGEDATREFTITPNDKSQFTTNLQWSNPSNYFGDVGLLYKTDSLVKVEIPDPQATSQNYTEIIDADKGITDNQMIDPLNYGFIQQMPWESQDPKDNRTQIPTWTLGAPADNATVVPSDKWKVQSQDDPTLGDGDVYNWFTAEDNTLTPTGGLTGKLAEDEFYNHYYKFNRSLNIDYSKPIARTLLKAKDGRYYFDYSGKVDLAVDDTNPTPEQEAGMNKNREEVKYDTAINFYAPLEYKYVNSVTGEEIPAGSLPQSAKATGDGIVTWDAPLTPQQLTDESYTQDTGQGDPPVIAGYAFDHSELNGSETDTQIKVTKRLRSEAPAGRQTGNLLLSLMADYGLNLNESKNEGEEPISFNQLVQPDSLTQILRAVDATDPANYDQNNVVTLYYTPVSYDVEIEVTKPNGDTLKANANSSFEVSSDDGETWGAVSGYDFAAGNTYKIRQKEAVDPYYTQAGESPAFTVEVDAAGNFTLTATDGDGYSFIRTELVDQKLKIKVINQPSGGIVLSQVEPLDYGTVQMPRKDMTINRVNPDWKIDFEDNRPPEDGNKLHLYVTLTKEFTDNNGAGNKKLAGILAFINEPGEITNNDLLVKDTQMPIKTIDAPKYGKDSVTWAKDAGFLLQLDRETEAKLHVGKDQNYQAELTFTLAEDPLP